MRYYRCYKHFNESRGDLPLADRCPYLSTISFQEKHHGVCFNSGCRFTRMTWTQTAPCLSRTCFCTIINAQMSHISVITRVAAVLSSGASVWVNVPCVSCGGPANAFASQWFWENWPSQRLLFLPQREFPTSSSYQPGRSLKSPDKTQTACLDRLRIQNKITFFCDWWTFDLFLYLIVYFAVYILLSLYHTYMCTPVRFLLFNISVIQYDQLRYLQ